MADEDKGFALRRRVASLLLSDTCNRIFFTCGAASVPPGSYSNVALALLSAPSKAKGKGDDRPISVKIEKQPKGADASYAQKENLLSFSDSAFDKGLMNQHKVVHEATHAIFDYQKSPFSIDQEAAAFVAGGMYLARELDKIKKGVRTDDPNDIGGMLMVQSVVIGIELWESNSNVVSVKQMALIKDLIKKYPPYGGDYFDPDRIKNDGFRPPFAFRWPRKK